MKKSTSPEVLVRCAASRDPMAIADMLDIKVHIVRYENSSLPGLTCMAQNRPSIFLNQAYFDKACQHAVPSSGLMEADMAMVAAHELGHACLHRKELRRDVIREYDMFSSRTSMEAEANRFAADLLIDGEILIELLRDGKTVLQTAMEMQVNVNLIMYRIRSLEEQGLKAGRLPYIPKNNFMGKIHGAGSSEWGI